MAIETYSQSSTPNTSPRISFSYDIQRKNPDSTGEIVPSSSSPLESFSDFDFFFENSIKFESSSADELFSSGLIRPKQIDQKFAIVSRQSSFCKPENPISSLLPLPIKNCADFESTEEVIIAKENLVEDKTKAQSKSFWKIKRSSSLHCENSHKKSSFWSLPLLSRSNSTGSVPYTKIRPTRDKEKQNLNKQHRLLTSSSSSSASMQKPPLKMRSGLKYNNSGVRVSPILSVPPPIISTNLFGFGSLFNTGKDKKSRK